MSSKIEWTEMTWNPIAGCTITSDGCQNCYAMTMAHRLGGMESTKAKYGGLTRKTTSGKVIWNREVKFDEKALLEPLKRKKPTMYFVNSMSDLFHETVPTEWIDKVFAIMALCPQHTFQILTKRAELMWMYFQSPKRKTNILYEMAKHRGDELVLTEEFKLLDSGLPLKNVWLGVSVENQKTYDERVRLLAKTPAQVRFISIEPLLEEIEILSFSRIEWTKVHWVIVGGESGHGARPMNPNWVRKIRQSCLRADTKFFLKQWGSWLPYEESEDTLFWSTPDGEKYNTAEHFDWCGTGKWHDIPDINDDTHDGVLYKKLKKKDEFPAVIDGKEWKQIPCQPTI